jgi:MFS family permease
MAISGSCCLLVGFLFGGNPFLLLLVAAIWGATVVADSAQFSACVTELGDPRYVGTALTMQTCVGFLLTTISIELIPYFVRAVGWQFAFAILAPGPLFGVFAMLRKRRRSHMAEGDLCGHLSPHSKEWTVLQRVDRTEND